MSISSIKPTNIVDELQNKALATTYTASYLPGFPKQHHLQFLSNHFRAKLSHYSLDPEFHLLSPSAIERNFEEIWQSLVGAILLNLRMKTLQQFHKFKNMRSLLNFKYLKRLYWLFAQTLLQLQQSIKTYT